MTPKTLYPGVALVTGAAGTGKFLCNPMTIFFGRNMRLIPSLA